MLNMCFRQHEFKFYCKPINKTDFVNRFMYKQPLIFVQNADSVHKKKNKHINDTSSDAFSSMS